jgi:GNAT superfamily N-acetyltransferase
MAVLRDFQGKGVGFKLVEAACNFAKQSGANTITVETLSPSALDENYKKTYDFYKSVGFAPLFNLKPNGYEWDMVYMKKNLGVLTLGENIKEISIKELNKLDIPVIVNAFLKVNWIKPASLFETYYQEQQNLERFVWLAYVGDQLAGYVTLKMTSQYPFFANKNIPEIMDLNVLPTFRKRGIGTHLLQLAEKKAASKSKVVGLGVGLYSGADGGYGSAQRLYVNLGYLPDGQGVTWNYQSAIPGKTYPLDDDLILWFTKKLE